MTTAPSDPTNLSSPTDLQDRQSDDSAAAAVAPGWYADPSGSGVPRWWDGTAWTAHVAPGHEVPVSPGTAPPAPDSHYTVHGYAPGSHSPPRRRPLWYPWKTRNRSGVAFLLTLFFGPLGMFYSTVNGAVIMTGALFIGAAVVFLVTLGIGVLVWVPAVWIVSIIWGCTAAHEQSRPQSDAVFDGERRADHDADRRLRRNGGRSFVTLGFGWLAWWPDRLDRVDHLGMRGGQQPARNPGHHPRRLLTGAHQAD